MKKQPFLLVVLCLFITAFSFAQQTEGKDSVKVWGNCESCKKRIETAALNAGALTAVWNEDTKFLLVTYDPAKTSNQKIQDKIAAVGHDTESSTAPAAVYSKLPGCCKYERKSVAVKQ